MLLDNQINYVKTRGEWFPNPTIPADSSRRNSRISPTPRMQQSARARQSSAPPEIASPETLSLLIEWQAAAIARKLETASSPKWKSRQKLYDEAMLEHYGPGTYMGPLTPTPGYTP